MIIIQLFNFFLSFTLILLSLIGLFYTNFFYVWVFFECLTLFFVIYMFTKEKGERGEAGLKYFLVQALASVIFIFFCFFQEITYNLFYSSLFVFISVVLKLGLFPFFHWFPYVSYIMSWKPIFFLFTSQKLLPLYILMAVYRISYIFLGLFIGSLFIILLQIGTFNLKLFFSYSSINHSLWILLGGFIDITIFCFYYSYYFIMSLILVFKFFIQNFKYIFISFYYDFFFLVIILSFSGIPPFIGFYGKWLIVLGVVFYPLYFLGFIISNMILGFYLYLRVFFYSYLIEIKEYNSKKEFSYYLYSFQFLPLFFF